VKSVNTIPEMLASVARRFGDRTAVVDGEERVTYSELLARVNRLAGELQQRGIDSKTRVALLLPNGLDFVLAYFAITATGALVVPMNAQYQERELLYFLEECEVVLLVAANEYEGLCRKVISKGAKGCQLLLEDEASQISLRGRDFGTLESAARSSDPVMYQFSSGSTGVPKCIARDHRNLIFELDSLTETLGISHKDRFLGVAPFSHVNGLMRSMMASMRAGASLFTLPVFDRKKVADLIEKEKISVFIAVPFMFGMLAKTRYSQPPDFSSLRLCISASAPMPEKANEQFYERFGIYVRQLYGSTETGTISVNLQENVEDSLLSIGTPIRGVEVEVFGDDGQPAGLGEMGEFAVKSPAAIKEYRGAEDANREAFRDGYFLTGDLGRRDEKGMLYLEGRKKFFINKGGYKINPQEIEDLLAGHPKVEEVAVVGVPTAFEDEKVKAVVVTSASCQAEEIVEYCRGKIADFKIPSLVEFREDLPKSPTGKIRKKLLL